MPEKNWLPIKRKDEDLSASLLVYVPDIEMMKSLAPPKAEKLSE
ncbi:hypothetical protein [Haliea sp. E17]